jgi:signal transduction histidine kinase/DNA-binding response OmpR family regulator/HAMP domain-containing protein
MEEPHKESLHLKFSQKVWLLPILTSAAFLLILSITWLGGQDQSRLLKRIQSDYYQGSEHINNMHDVVISIHQELRDAATLGDDDKLEDADALAQEYLAVSGKCKTLDGTDVALAEKGEATFQLYYREALEVTHKMIAGAALEEIRDEANRMNQRYSELLESLDALEHNQVKSMQTALDRAHKAQVENQSLIIGIICICLGILVGFAVVTTRSIVRPIRQITVATEALARGDIQQHLEFQSSDEMGRLANAYRAMIDSIRARAEAAGKIAAGDLDVDLRIASEEDVLGNAMANMASRLAEKAKTADEIARGNLNVRVPIASENDVLGKAMDVMVKNLRADIAESERVREALLKAKLEAEEATKTKSAFLANMSHEIRTPMNGVIGMTDLLLDTQLTQEQRDFADAVHASANSLMSIINDILDFSKIEAGKLELESIGYDLRQVIEDIGTIMAPKAHQKGVEFPVFVDPAMNTLVVGDPGRLRQIITNLANNALKFTEKGDVQVAARLISRENNTQKILFEVKDTGIGIPADRINRIFDSFSQVDASTTRKYGGTGLGLTIAKSLVESMNGTIQVESEVGKGSRFFFTIQLPEQSVPKETEASGTLAGQKILLGENNLLSAEYIAKLCARWGCAVTVANDFVNLVQQLERPEAQYDCVLMDFHMPGSNMNTLLDWMRSSSRYESTRVVLLTWVTYRSSAAVVNLGGDAVLPKPIRAKSLYETLLASIETSHREAAKDEEETPITIPSKKDPEDLSILLVEDNHVNKMVALNLLKKAGYHADAVNNGLEALQALENKDYDLILMDVQMPEMDGYEATSAIRKGEIKPAIPIIGLTANAMKGDREKCIEAGMDDYLSKPMRPNLLYAIIEKWT